MTRTFIYDGTFKLECGETIANLHLAYTTVGVINEKKDNVIWIFHALTGNSNPLEWWPGLVGEGCLITPEKYFIVCVNMPGSCYGSIGPLSMNSQNGKPYFHSFPWFTTRDMINAYKLLRIDLGINNIKVGIGGSMGGQQLLEWAIEEPSLFETIIPIASNAKHSAWGIAFNASQRLCIENDVTWKEENKLAGINGMKTARSIALLSYRNHETYDKLQQGTTSATTHLPVNEHVFKAETYQQYQGEKLAKRFNAFSYYALSKAMDNHNVGRGRGNVISALKQIKAKVIAISISTDLLFPPQEQAFVAKHVHNGQHRIIESLYGHDGFLLEYQQLTAIIGEYF